VSRILSALVHFNIVARCTKKPKNTKRGAKK
jgi:hypothetical protein